MLPVRAFAAVTVALTPDLASVRPEAVAFFTATVSGTPNVQVRWYVNNIEGGNATLGTISAGKYTAPAVRPATAVTLKAVSVADPTVSDSSAITVLNPVPSFADVTPRFINTGLSTTIRAFGSKFVSGARIYWGATPLTTTLVSATELRAVYTPADAAGAIVSLRVRNPDPGAVFSDWTHSVTILAPITVSISPPSISLRLGEGMTFPSAIYNSQNPALASIHPLWAQRKLAAVANVGMLVQPTTRAQYLARLVPLPSNLFSHADQQQQWASPQNLSVTGWCGRMADRVQGLNTPSVFPQAVAVSGNSQQLVGTLTTPISVSEGAALLGNDSSPLATARLASLQETLEFDSGLAVYQAARPDHEGRACSRAITGRCSP